MSRKQKSHQAIIPGHALGAAVVGNDVNFAIKNWRKRLKESGIIEKLKSRKEFEKPSITKRKQKDNAIYYQKLNDLTQQF